jgi:maltose O-acetyltransferase
MMPGALYDPGDPDLVDRRAAISRWMARYNASLGEPVAARRALLRDALGAVGEAAGVRPPFHVDYGSNIHLGARVFLNFGCIILDICPVRIGDGTKIGPGTQILTADHPRDAAGRASGLEFGRPVTIGANVWIGAGALILPGVVIGDDAVVGAGAVVTRSVAANTTVVGNPARTIPPHGNIS